jgi:hypothetical protein
VRVRSTLGKFVRVCGVLPQVGDWFLLYFSKSKLADGLPSLRSPLQAAGFTNHFPSWVFYGEKLLDDRGEEPPRHPVGAATTDCIDWAMRIAQASNFPTDARADASALMSLLGNVDVPKKVVIRDVGQANFSCLKDIDGNIVLYYDVGWPLSFNQKTAPPKFPIDFTRAPIVLSHWDWDHLHHALRPEGHYLAECQWVAPIQKLGPGAKWFANELHKNGRLKGWNAGALTFSFGTIGPCNAPPDSSNNSGLAMAVVLSSGHSFLLVGDADYEFLPSCLKASVDGLAATHHGARFASDWTVIPKPNAGRTRFIVSYGTGNSYGHPHADALKKHLSAGWRQVISTASYKGISRNDREFA